MNLTGLKRKPCSLWLPLQNSHWKDKSKSRETGEEALSSSVHHIYCENDAVLSSQTADIPGNVERALTGGAIIMKGPKGTLQRVQSHSNANLSFLGKKKRETVGLTNGEETKRLASTWIICSHVQNVIKGVTLGFCYKMKPLYAHFPHQWHCSGEGFSHCN